MTGFAAYLPFPADLLLTAGLTAVLIAVSVIDLRTLRIPDAFSFPLIATGLGLAWLSQRAHGLDHLIGAGAGWASFAAIGAAHFRLRETDGLGRGDAKLFAAAGAWLGWQALPIVLLIAAVGGLVQALVTRGGREGGPLAFGPWLALGFWVVWIAEVLNGR